MSCRTRRKVVGAVYKFLAYVLLPLVEPTGLVSASCKRQGRYLIAIKLQNMQATVTQSQIIDDIMIGITCRQFLLGKW